MCLPESYNFWKKLFLLPLYLSLTLQITVGLVILQKSTLFQVICWSKELSSEFDGPHEIDSFPTNCIGIRNSEKFFLVKNVVQGSWTIL